jgi:hypothetical protein
MSDAALLESKQKEVENMAARLGVEDYLGTERTGQVKAILAEWAVLAEGTDFLTQESLWLDAKEEIENLLTDIALTHNAKHEMFLLGAAQAGVISLDEVRTGFIEAWNRLMMQYRIGISLQPDRTLTNFDRERDKVLASIPIYGTIEDKQEATTMATRAVRELEGRLIQIADRGENQRLQATIAEKETTRSMILAEAEAGRRENTMPHGDYKQLQMLVGRSSNSLYEGQLLSLKRFQQKPELALDQMDRSIDKAMRILDHERDRAGWLEMFVTTERQDQLSGLGNRGSNTGDGIRAPSTMNLASRVKVLGPGGHPQGAGEPPWVGQPLHMINNQPSIINNTPVNPANEHRVTNVHPNGLPSSAPARAFFGTHQMRNEGLYPKPLGGSSITEVTGGWGGVAVAIAGLWILAKTGKELMLRRMDIKATEAAPAIDFTADFADLTDFGR